MKKALVYFLEFVGIQLVMGFVMGIIWMRVNGNGDRTPIQLVITTAVTSITTIIIFLWAGWTKVSPSWLRTRPWIVLVWCCIAALGALLPSMWLQEQMPELPNWAEDEFEAILGNRWGFISVALLAPVSEEIVMRGAVLKSLLKSSRLSSWGAIAISAVLFALVHMNPVQMPHAFLIGLLLGWMYWRTGSIIPGIAYHWINNSAAVILHRFFPDPDTKMIDIFMGNQTNVLLAVAFSLCILVPAIYQLHVWMRRVDA